MTATPERGQPDPDWVIGLNVHTLLYRGRRRQKELALVLGLTPSVLSKKMRGESAWSAKQVQSAADFLGVTPGRLYEVTVQSLRRNLSAIAGGGSGGEPRPRQSPLMKMVVNARNPPDYHK